MIFVSSAACAGSTPSSPSLPGRVTSETSPSRTEPSGVRTLSSSRPVVVSVLTYFFSFDSLAAVCAGSSSRIFFAASATSSMVPRM